MILGFTTMRGLVLSSSIFKIFSPKNPALATFDYRKLWKHSLLTAIASRDINKYLYFQEQEDIFSAAILHDIGKIILDQYDHDNYAKVIQEIKSPFLYKEILDIEMRHCEVTHEEIGYQVAEGWNLPYSLSTAIKFHHNPLESTDNQKLTSIVYLGNILAKIALDNHVLDISIFDQSVLDYLGLNENDLINLNSQIIQEVDNIKDFELFLK